MTALYIIGSIAAVIALILFMYVKLYITFTADSFSFLVKLGPVKIPLSKKKKINIKKTARKLKGKKLSDIKQKKKKTAKKKKAKKQKSVFGDLKDIIFDADSESSKKELLGRLLVFIKAVALKFMSKVKIDINSLKIGVDAGDAHSSAIACGILWQSVAALLETVGTYSHIKSYAPGAVSVSPVFNDGKFIYDISVKIKIRAASLIGVALSSFITFAKIYLKGKADKDISISKPKQTNTEKRKEEQK